MMIRGVLAAAMLVASAPAWTHGEAHGGKSAGPQRSMEETAFGRTGDPKKVSRTVHVSMSDRMRFTPDKISVVRGRAMATKVSGCTPDRFSVERGETIRFVVKNDGQVLHEMVLGSEDALKEHAALMKKFPGMEHDEPYMVHVAPGKTGEIVWQFSRAGTVHFGCLIPGHFEAGMVGKVEVKK